jgi:hypothetical protein
MRGECDQSTWYTHENVKIKTIKMLFQIHTCDILIKNYRSKWISNVFTNNQMIV